MAATITTKTAPVRPPADLAAALAAVTSALVSLRRDPRSSDVDETVRRALVAVDALAPGVTQVVLRRVLASVDECHRAGVPSSIPLRVRTRAAGRAIRLDPARSG